MCALLTNLRVGMHSIKERAVVVDGQIVVRPIMVVALTYDHRLLDGREAVTFLGTSLLHCAALAFDGLLSPVNSQDPGLPGGSEENAACCIRGGGGEGMYSSGMRRGLSVDSLVRTPNACLRTFLPSLSHDILPPPPPTTSIAQLASSHIAGQLNSH